MKWDQFPTEIMCLANDEKRLRGMSLDDLPNGISLLAVAAFRLSRQLKSEVTRVVSQDKDVNLRITAAHTRQSERYAKIPNCMVNADAEGAVLQAFATPNADGQALLIEISERFGLTARGYHRVMRVARTIAELAASEVVERAHIAKAASFRLPVGRGPSQPRKSRKAAAAAQPEKMAMANESSP